MGTDIHAALEYQPHPGLLEWGWDCLANHVFVSRDYSLFSIMANVRNEKSGVPWKPLPFIAGPRGLPLGASSEVKALIKEGGGHSHSYLSYNELLRVQEIYGAIVSDEVGEPVWLPRGTPLSTTCEVYEETDLERAYYRFRMWPPRPASRDPMVLTYCPKPGRWGPNVNLEAILAFLRIFEEQGLRTRMVFFFDS